METLITIASPRPLLALVAAAAGVLLSATPLEGQSQASYTYIDQPPRYANQVELTALTLPRLGSLLLLLLRQQHDQRSWLAMRSRAQASSASASGGTGGSW
jgi:hypothetical protein